MDETVLSNIIHEEHYSLTLLRWISLPNEVLCHYVASVTDMESYLKLIMESHDVKLLISGPGLKETTRCGVEQLQILQGLQR